MYISLDEACTELGFWDNLLERSLEFSPRILISSCLFLVTCPDF